MQKLKLNFKKLSAQISASHKSDQVVSHPRLEASRVSWMSLCLAIRPGTACQRAVPQDRTRAGPVVEVEIRLVRALLVGETQDACQMFPTTSRVRLV